jgi:hypothetical protein
MSGDSWNDDDDEPPSVSTDVFIKLDDDDFAAVERCEAIFERHRCMFCQHVRVKHGVGFMWYLVANDCLEAACRELTAAGFKYDTRPYDPRELKRLQAALTAPRDMRHDA